MCKLIDNHVFQSTHPCGVRLQLSHKTMTWLEKSTRPKQATFGGIGGGRPPEVTWEDGCACIGMLGEPNPHDTPETARRRKAVKALCELLVWGITKDTEANMAIIEQHLASVMFVACQGRKQGEPRGIGLTLKDLTGKMARMVLWHELYNMWDWHTVVSIHAPVWGATLKFIGNQLFLCFNPRTRVGCDARLEIVQLDIEFQSTHPCGVRQ